jgi:hypothetical protein
MSGRARRAALRHLLPIAAGSPSPLRVVMESAPMPCLPGGTPVLDSGVLPTDAASVVGYAKISNFRTSGDLTNFTR